TIGDCPPLDRQTKTPVLVERRREADTADHRFLLESERRAPDVESERPPVPAEPEADARVAGTTGVDGSSQRIGAVPRQRGGIGVDRAGADVRGSGRDREPAELPGREGSFHGALRLDQAVQALVAVTITQPDPRLGRRDGLAANLYEALFDVAEEVVGLARLPIRRIDERRGGVIAG